MLELGSVFMLLTLVVFMGCGVFAAPVRTHLLLHLHIMTWMSRVFAEAFIWLAARLALTEQ